MAVRKTLKNPVARFSAASLKETFANNLRHRLRERRLTQAQFGEIVGVVQPQVAEWVSGSYLPPADTLAKICNSLGVPPEYLLKDRYQDLTDFAM